jgi:hypothetical protein
MAACGAGVGEYGGDFRGGSEAALPPPDLVGGEETEVGGRMKRRKGAKPW